MESVSDASQTGNDDTSSFEEATTMMICNIPCKFGYHKIVEAIHSVGFRGTYDFVHVPNRKGKRDANIGYALSEN